jgi:hypothetical protein
MRKVQQWNYRIRILLVCLILVFVGCSKEEKKQTETPKQSVLPAAPATTPQLDPCTLVTKEEIREIFGVDAGDPALNKTNKTICDFKIGDFDSISLMALLQVGENRTPDRIMEELKKQNIPVKEVSGVGDRAFFANHGFGMIQLNAFKGNHYVILTVNLSNLSEEKKNSATEELMRKALARL